MIVTLKDVQPIGQELHALNKELTALQEARPTIGPWSDRATLKAYRARVDAVEARSVVVGQEIQRLKARQ